MSDVVHGPLVLKRDCSNSLNWFRYGLDDFLIAGYIIEVREKVLIHVLGFLTCEINPIPFFVFDFFVGF